MNNKPKTKIAASKPTLAKASAFTEAQKLLRSNCLMAAATLVGNPVHAFAATPQNVMNLAHVFYHFAEGIEIPMPTPQSQAQVEAQGNKPGPQTYA